MGEHSIIRAITALGGHQDLEAQRIKGTQSTRANSILEGHVVNMSRYRPGKGREREGWEREKEWKEFHAEARVWTNTQE